MVLSNFDLPSLVSKLEVDTGKQLVDIKKTDPRLKKIQKLVDKHLAKDNNRDVFYQDVIVDPTAEPLTTSNFIASKIVKLLLDNKSVIEIANYFDCKKKKIDALVNKYRLVDKRCYCFNNDGYMVVKTKTIKQMYDRLRGLGVINNSLVSFKLSLVENNDKLVVDDKVIGRISAKKLIRVVKRIQNYSQK